jgi:hypothetical protein
MKALVALSLFLVVLAAVAAPVFAGSCPKLVAEIQAMAGSRLDATAYAAKEKAAQADKLHKEGKHADSEKVAKEALASLGKKM